METLKVKDIAKYLPYSLTCSVNGIDQLIVGLNGCRIMCNSTNEGRKLIDTPRIDQIKPYLRPLSSLTEEIYHKGDVFIPMVRLLNIALGHYEDGVLELAEANVKGIEIRQQQYQGACYVVNYKSSLFEKHSLVFKDGCFSHVWHHGHFKSGVPNLQALTLDNQELLFEKLNEWKFDSPTRDLIGKGLALPLIIEQ